MSLPDSFYRAEAAWLDPPEYRPNPVDAEEDITRIKGEFRELADDFTDAFFENVEESYDLEKKIKAARGFLRDLERMRDEMEDAEDVLRCQPDPDAEWDNRGIY